MNVELLRKIQAHNTAHPEQLDMEELLSLDCGTVACIAGHALLLSGEQPPLIESELGTEINFDGVWDRGECLLDIDPDKSERLFIDAFWPKALLDRLYGGDASVGSAEYAAIVNARIDHFIATGGAE